ncbi:hypothetical protein Sjap_019694 [Stephania japonica]|uniref:non-specific serine/threonine protein kinase n=1 Tax=Stephania japonica TaxID=461633 RepID=A0AAP0F1Z6_9MAGN
MDFGLAFARKRGSVQQRAFFLHLLVLELVLVCALSLVRAETDDGATLLEIKKSLRDVENVLYQWTDSSDYCYWRGVTCDNVTFSVIALNLSSLNMNGEISPAIGDLKSLVFLDLKGNYLTGQIPDEIGDCSSLEKLDLSFNEITGDIPYSISKLKQLDTLILKNNQLTGPIPSTLSQIPNLKILGLRDNNLTGTLSPDMCQLTGLCDVKNNSLTGSIPESVGNCTSFQVLYVYALTEVSWNDHFECFYRDGTNRAVSIAVNHSSFEVLLVQWFTLFPSLISFFGLIEVFNASHLFRYRDLSCNLLSGPIPSILGNLSYTGKLYLHGNKLTGSIPPELGNMSMLHYLELNDNLLTGRIPPELGKLTDLYELNLHGNRLNGTIPPAFEKLESMTYLNLSSNKLRGQIPVELSQIGNLDTLDLADNMISGPIPFSVGDLEHLLKLNLSKNHLTGCIPAEFGNLRSIMSIDLSSNHLSGPVPPELGQLQTLFSMRVEHNNLSGDILFLFNSFSLTVLNVSYNNLVGDIPISTNFSKFSPDSFLGNPGLCGYWLKSSCHTSQPPERATIPKAAILGIAVGALVILLMILVAVWRPHSPAHFPEGNFEKPDFNYAQAYDLISVDVSFLSFLVLAYGLFNLTSPKLVILNMNMALHVYDDIMRMTENLSEKFIIGYGTSSTVYKCTLKNCRPVAVKRLYTQYPHNLKQFETELETIGCIKHRNLISLQGYSLSPSGNLLFYDFMENGSLWDLLHGPSKKHKLDWNTRIKIALGAAQGLAYLHHDCSPRIIHRDVKSPNILLDKDFEAHLTDFGIAKSLCMSESHTSTCISGTIGYIDPEYARTSRLTEKSDVYSYGIVLLELLTGRKAVDDDSNLHQLISSKAANNAVMETVDPEVSSTCKDLGAVKKLFQLALLCTKRQSSDRPTMHEVVRVLGSLVPPIAPMSLPALPLPPPSSKISSYMEEYSNLKDASMINCSSMSTSDAQLFLKFGEVISQTSE